MLRGDAATFSLQVMAEPAYNAPRDAVPGPQDLTGWYAVFTMKWQLPDPDTVAIAQVTSKPYSQPSGGSVTFPNITAGWIEVQLPPAATTPFPDSAVDVVYDVKVFDPSNNPRTVEIGTYRVRPNVSRLTAPI